jgi:hypothetical protein
VEARAAGNGLSKIGGAGDEFHQVQGNILITTRAYDSCKGLHESSKRRVQLSIVTSAVSNQQSAFSQTLFHCNGRKERKGRSNIQDPFIPLRPSRPLR